MPLAGCLFMACRGVDSNKESSVSTKLQVGSFFFCEKVFVCEE